MAKRIEVDRSIDIDIDTYTMSQLKNQVEAWIKSYGEKAYIDISSEEGYYGGHSVRTTLYYKQLETQEEADAREANEKVRKERDRAWKIAQIERLKKELGE